MIKKTKTSDVSRQVKAGIVLVLLCLLLIFALQNSASVTVVFLLWEMTLPRVLLFFVFFVVGFLAGLAVSNWRKISHKHHTEHTVGE
jgi:uncharacterized integral membrane protein